MNKLRWGILGAAQIARKNWKAIFNSGEGVVAAVASREPTRAVDFIRECQAEFPFAVAPRAFASYEQLLAASDIDAVYIPLPTAVRKIWVVRAAAAGKHVLCEKPCAISATDLREMIAACHQHRVQFMDGVMFMHNPRLSNIRAALDQADGIGAIHRIMSMFTFAGDLAAFERNIRTQRMLEPAGCLGDLGWYCLRIALFVMRWELPQFATGRILATAADGVTPTQFSGELIFANGASAGFYCSFVTESQQWVTVSGGNGALRMDDFVHPYNTYEPAFSINRVEQKVRTNPELALPAGAEALQQMGHPTAQDTRMFQNFAAQVRSGTLSEFWPDVALKTQLVQDACLASARTGGGSIAVAAR